MKRYSLEVTEDDNGRVSMKTISDGFHGFEVLGFLDFKIEDVRRQLRQDFAPDQISRQVVVDAEV